METEFEPNRKAIRRALQSAVALDFPHPFRPALTGRPAAVLILGGIRANGAFEILLTRRTENLETHKGQYALPGGMRDSESESPETTALRETQEEMGIAPDEVEVFGRLPPIWTPTGFTITPVVGLLRRPIDEIAVHPNLDEIDFWFWCGIDRLRATGTYTTETRVITHQGASRTVPIDVYQVDEHRIWGATGAMLRNFIGRLEKVETAN
jgi:8-oxo-dGTP pyrophosphatase MutT (NUDIX family)